MGDEKIMQNAEKLLREFENRVELMTNSQVAMLLFSISLIILIIIFSKSMIAVLTLMAIMFLFVVLIIFFVMYVHSPAYEIYKLMLRKFSVLRLPNYPSVVLVCKSAKKNKLLEDIISVFREMKFENVKIDKNGIVEGINRMDARGLLTKINLDWMVMKRYHYQFARANLRGDKLILSVSSRYPGIDLFKLSKIRDRLNDCGYCLSSIPKIETSKLHQRKQRNLWIIYLLSLLLVLLSYIIWYALK